MNWLWDAVARLFAGQVEVAVDSAQQLLDSRAPSRSLQLKLRQGSIPASEVYAIAATELIGALRSNPSSLRRSRFLCLTGNPLVNFESAIALAESDSTMLLTMQLWMVAGCIHRLRTLSGDLPNH